MLEGNGGAVLGVNGGPVPAGRRWKDLQFNAQCSDRDAGERNDATGMDPAQSNNMCGLMYIGCVLE